MFGVHIEQHQTGTNRFLRLAETHPKLYRYCIERLELGKVLDYIGVPYRPEQVAGSIHKTNQLDLPGSIKGAT